MRILIVLLSLCAYAQDTPPGSSSAAKIVGPRGDALPATCVDGQLWQRTGSTSPGLYNCAGGTWIAPGGGTASPITLAAGIVDPTTGPVSCTAPSGSNLALYFNTTGVSLWQCVGTNTWAKILSTPDSGVFNFVADTGTASATPAAGSVACWLDSTANTFQCKDSGGNVFTASKTAASRTANQFVTHVSSTGIPATAAIAQADLPAATRRRSYGVAVGDPAGSALATGVLGYLVVEAACTIVGWDIVVDAGTATVDVWKIATGTAKPTVTNTITASAKPAIATGTAIHSTTLTGWTTSITANDILGFNLDAVATAKYIMMAVQCDQ